MPQVAKSASKLGISGMQGKQVGLLAILGLPYGNGIIHSGLDLFFGVR